MVNGVTSTLTQPRTEALARRIAALSTEEGRGDGLALGLVDALLSADRESLEAALPKLRYARKRAGDSRNERLLGWLDAAIALVHWGLERLAPAGGEVAGGTQAHEFLAALRRSPDITSSRLRELLETDETQVSRTGRRLLEAGLVLRRKVGRQAFWSLTPLGQRAIEDAPHAPDAPSTTQLPPDEFWMEAIRRGFEGAGGDEPGVAREVDPTRERIIESTLGLHHDQGILATTYPQIAAAAGVPVETVQGYFPTRDDLIMGCGSHVLEGLRIPPPERAPEIFEDAASIDARMQVLVETLFSVYERGGGDMGQVTKERHELPLVEQSMSAVDRSIEALIREALGPTAGDQVAVDSLRALIGVSVWQAMRELGASHEETVEKATAAVEGWLEARPAGP
jgi:AcrR family transcriptional regulator/DNA-binding MarR family transcriptional regulator